MKELEEKKELAQEVKELEFCLANQKEKYDDMKQDLRDENAHCLVFSLVSEKTMFFSTSGIKDTLRIITLT